MTSTELAPTIPVVNHVRAARVVRWVDGDTVWLDVDHDYRQTGHLEFRLFGMDTPERGQMNWAEATAFVRAAAPTGSLVVIRTFKDPDKYGRWLCEVFTTSPVSLNQALVDAGLAVLYFGGKKPPAVTA
jgi:micrococcal nuclease